MKNLLLLLFIGLFLQVNGQKGKEEVLEALGGSGALLLYDTYLVIGEAADAFSREAYDAAEVEKIVHEQIGGIEAVQKQYEALFKVDFITDPKDKEFMQELVDAFSLVVEEGNALITYVNSEKDPDALSYDAKRKIAWETISDILGFED